MRLGLGVALVVAGMSALPLWGQSIPANGDFEAGKEGWGLPQQEGARAEFSVVEADSPSGGRAGRLRVVKQGLVQHLQLMHSFDTHAPISGVVRRSASSRSRNHSRWTSH